MSDFLIVADQDAFEDNFVCDDDDQHNDRSGGFRRMNSYRNLPSDRAALLKSDSKRSLLTRGIHKLKKKTIGSGDDTTDDDDEITDTVSLVEYEMLKAQLRAAQSDLIQKQAQINLLNTIVTEKDETIEELAKQLQEASNNSNNNSKNEKRSNARPRVHRRSSLEEKRMKKRLLENSFGASRSPEFVSKRVHQSFHNLPVALPNAPQSARPNRQKQKMSRVASLNSTLGSLSLPLKSPDERKNATFQQQSRSSELKKSASWAKLRANLTSPVGTRKTQQLSTGLMMTPRSPATIKQNDKKKIEKLSHLLFSEELNPADIGNTPFNNSKPMMMT